MVQGCTLFGIRAFLPEREGRGVVENLDIVSFKGVRSPLLSHDNRNVLNAIFALRAVRVCVGSLEVLYREVILVRVEVVLGELSLDRFDNLCLGQTIDQEEVLCDGAAELC